MNTYLRITTSTLDEIVGTPVDEIIIAVSSDAADTQNAAVSGTVASSADSETMALTGQVEVAGTKLWDSVTRISLASAATGAIAFRRPGTKAGGAITVQAQPSNNDTIVVGLAGNTRTYTFKTALSAGPSVANEILIGANRFETARNLANAINDDTGEGTRYSTGTTINALLSAYADAAYSDTTLDGTAQATIYLRDKIACARLLAWTLTYSGTASNMTLTSPVGGVNGEMVAEIAPGNSGAGEAHTLDNATTPNLPAGEEATYDAIQVHGRSAMLWVDMEATGGGVTNVTFTIKGGPSATLLKELDTLVSSGTTLVRSDLLEGCEYISVSITDNTNTDMVAVRASLVY